MIKKYLEFINESTGGKKAFLFEGPSSSGKTYLSKALGAKHFYEASPSDIVIIGSDDFAGESERKIKYDHAGDGQDQKAGDEFHKRMSIERKGDLAKRGATSVSFPKHPKNKDYVKGTDPRVWYMAQEFKYGHYEKVIFDDIGDDITKYIPNVTSILLYTPIEFMVKNISARNDSDDENEQRDPNEVLNNQYTNYYKAVYDEVKSLDGKKWTIEELKDTLKGLKGLNIDDFISKMGIKDDNFWIGLRNKQKGEIVNTRDPKSIQELKGKI